MTRKFSPAQLADLFRRAWTLAREGASRFGGRVRSYFAAALREAYKAMTETESAAAEPAVEKVEFSPRDGDGWIAHLTGKDTKYTYARSFLPKRKVGDRREPDLVFEVPLVEGRIYEWRYKASRSSRRPYVEGYWRIEGGKRVEIDVRTVEEALQ